MNLPVGQVKREKEKGKNGEVSKKAKGKKPVFDKITG